MQNILLVFIGGGAGAALRYGINGMSVRLLGSTFPCGTPAINVGGSFLMGLLVGWLALKGEHATPLRLLLAHGAGAPMDSPFMAAMATGRRGGVVRRWSVGEDAPERRPAALTWRSRLANACTRLTLWGRDPIAVSWPGPSSRHGRAELPAGEAVPAALWIVPAADHDERTAVALRAAARLVGRHPSLRIVLLGEVAALQSTRVHAASLGLTAFVQVAPIDTLLLADNIDAAAVWVTADGDDVAIHLFEVAGDGDLVHRKGGRAALDPETGDPA